MKRILAMILCLLMAMSLFTTAALADDAAPSDEEMAAWAEANGYVKMQPDLISSATENKAGGVNYGAIEWSEELQVAAVKEWLKGGTFIGSPDYAQDDSGYNYREMYQMATSYNNVPYNTNLELVLDADNLHLLGVSEAGTSKTLQFSVNPVVSISWVKQLRLAEEEMGYNYYCSYGVTYNGTVKIYGADALETEEGQDALINLFDKYYPTLASTWAQYSRMFAAAETEEAVREAKIAYIGNLIAGGSMVIYEIIPTKIIITCPFMINMAPQMMNAALYTTKTEEGYAYNLDITEGFLDSVIAYKNAYLADEANLAAVEEYYSTGMYPMLDEYCAQYGLPTCLEYTLMDNSCAGMKTQTTYVPAE